VLSGCVSLKSFEQLESERDELLQAQAANRLTQKDAEINRREMEGRMAVLEKARTQLEADTTKMGQTILRNEQRIASLLEMNDVLNEQNSGRLATMIEENEALLGNLARTREELQAQEDSLIALGIDLDARSRELAARSARVEELESLLAARDAAATALRMRVAEALLGFKDKGLTVEQRDGKVYVSLEAKLLFPSGSTTINPDGQQALLDLGQVISTQSDLEVIVEGHTDTDQIRSSGNIPRNNWELSVLRATAVVELLTQDGGVDPLMLTASGRSEFHPVDEEDKAKNRRIEVVLAPNLGELYDLIRND
jgi:chemotaxis protein MotB